MSSSSPIRGLPPRTACLLAALGFVLASSHAEQATAQAEESYDDVIVEAVEEFQRGNFAESYALFRQAHALRPSARTQRGMGVAAFEAKRYADAIHHLGAALDDERRALDANQRAEVEQALAQAARFVARVGVEISPVDGHLRVDGQPARVQGGVVLLDPGPHELEVSAEGYAGERRLLRLGPGEHIQLRVVLEPATVAAAPPVGPTAAPTAASPPRRAFDARWKRASVTSMVLGEVMLGAGMVTALRASAANTNRAECSSGDCPGDRTARLRRASYALLPAGAAALLTGGVWWRVGNRQRARVRASALCQRDGCSIRVDARY